MPQLTSLHITFMFITMKTFCDIKVISDSLAFERTIGRGERRGNNVKLTQTESDFHFQI